MRAPLAPPPPAPAKRRAVAVWKELKRTLIPAVADKSAKEIPTFRDGDFSDTDEVENEVPDDISFRGEHSEDEYEEAFDRFPGRRVSVEPQPTVGHGGSRFGLHPDKFRVSRSQPHLTLQYRADNESLYRYDTRHHDVIFNEGFRPWNGKAPRSLAHYQKHVPRTAVVSASRNPGDYLPYWAVARDGLANLYVIHAPGGIDMIATLKRRAGLEMQEVAFWKGIRPEFIDRVEVVRKTSDSEAQVIKVINRDSWLKELERKGRTLADGSWRGPGGLTLDATTNQMATRLWRNTNQLEPRVTVMMQYLVTGVGSHVEFFSSFKEEHSLKRKLATQLHENPRVSPKEAVLQFNDAIRYTVRVTRDDRYSQRVNDVLSEMRRRQGFVLLYLKNTWGKPGYQGINTGWHHSLLNVNFEVQFHTRQSHAARDSSHELFEILRLPGKDASELAVLKAKMQDMFHHVPVPSGATSLGKHGEDLGAVGPMNYAALIDADHSIAPSFVLPGPAAPTAAEPSPSRDRGTPAKDPFLADQARRRRIRELSVAAMTVLADAKSDGVLRRDWTVRAAEEIGRLRSELLESDLRPFLAGPESDLRQGLERREVRLRAIVHSVNGRPPESQEYQNAVEECEALKHQADEIRAELAGRAKADTDVQQMVPGLTDMRITRHLIDGENPDKVLQAMRAESSALSDRAKRLDSAKHAAERQLIEHGLARVEEDQRLYRALAARPGVWKHLDQVSALRLVLAERRILRVWRQDMSAAHRRILFTPLFQRLYSLSRNETKAEPFLNSLHDHLSKRMSLVSMVGPSGTDGGPLFAALAEGLDAQLGEVVARATDARPVASPKERALSAALVSNWFQPTGEAVRPGSVVIHWKPEVRERTLHTFTTEDMRAATDGSHGATLSSLYPLLVHGGTDAVRLALAEATGFSHDHELRQRLASGRPATDAHFPALIHGELSWRDVKRIVLTHGDAASEQQAERDRDRLEQFARRYDLDLGVELRRLPGAPPADYVPGPVLSRPVGTALKDESGGEARTVGRDFTPFADRETNGLGDVVVDQVAIAYVRGNGYGITRSGAPWASPGQPAAFVVRAVGAADGIRVQLGNGTTTRLSAAEFADLLAGDADVRRLTPGAPLVLVVPFGGARGLLLPRLVAARTGREVWSAGGPLALLSDTKGKWLITRFLVANREAPVGPWVLTRPGDLALRVDTVETGAPSRGVLPTLDGSVVLDSDVVTHTIVGPTGRSVGRASHSVTDQARREPNQHELYKLTRYRVAHLVEDRMTPMAEPSETPWAADIAAGFTPYFFNAHGHARWVALETSVGGTQSSNSYANRTVRVDGSVLGGYLRRRPSLAQLPSETPVVLMACSTGDGSPGDSQLVAQLVADGTGRVVYAPSGPASLSGAVAQGKSHRLPGWRRFEPGARSAPKSTGQNGLSGRFAGPLGRRGASVRNTDGAAWDGAAPHAFVDAAGIAHFIVDAAGTAAVSSAHSRETPDVTTDAPDETMNGTPDVTLVAMADAVETVGGAAGGAGPVYTVEGPAVLAASDGTVLDVRGVEGTGFVDALEEAFATGGQAVGGLSGGLGGSGADALRGALARAVREGDVPSEGALPVDGVEVTTRELEAVGVTLGTAQRVQADLLDGRLPLVEVGLAPHEQLAVLFGLPGGWNDVVARAAVGVAGRAFSVGLDVVDARSGAVTRVPAPVGRPRLVLVRDGEGFRVAVPRSGAVLAGAASVVVPREGLLGGVTRRVGAVGRGVGAMGRGVDGPAFHAIVDAGGRIIGAAR
ncbi:hypothetical protein ABZ379_49840, partial [Streptomyces canus]|uniref:scabin-related ADP-ribosyltransferase n=1 Tax=Streptomyces canus TaxID=58343 RepID=UPI0033EA1E18